MTGEGAMVSGKQCHVIRRNGSDCIEFVVDRLPAIVAGGAGGIAGARCHDGDPRQLAALQVGV